MLIFNHSATQQNRRLWNGTDGFEGSDEWSEDLADEGFQLPIIYPVAPMVGTRDVAAPVPEPTGALLFGLGLLAVGGHRARVQRRR